MTSWPRRSSASSTFGLTVTRSLRPPVNTSTVPSSFASMKIPNPDGGWASRSISSLSETIWSRASLRVATSRSFCAVSDAMLDCSSTSRWSMARLCLGDSASLRRSTATSCSRKATWLARSSGLRCQP
jgi:hypothetical protein